MTAGQDEAAPGQVVDPEPPRADEGVPVGPPEEEEASFLAGQEPTGPAPVWQPEGPLSPPEPTGPGDLPSLDDLVQRIPASTRALVDELFHARFVAVKHLPRSAFKS